MHFLSEMELLKCPCFLSSEILLGRDMKRAGMSSFVLGVFLTSEVII